MRFKKLIAAINAIKNESFDTPVTTKPNHRVKEKTFSSTCIKRGDVS